jgi:DNA-binding response OmpR family regulator
MKKILVVDDSIHNLEFINIFLDMEGYLVFCIKDGAQINDAVKVFNPNLILLDIMLGETDGFDLCRMIKDTPNFSHIPIMMMSGTRHINTIKKKASGAEDVIVKPFDLDVFSKKVHDLV